MARGERYHRNPSIFHRFPVLVDMTLDQAHRTMTAPKCIRTTPHSLDQYYARYGLSSIDINR